MSKNTVITSVSIIIPVYNEEGNIKELYSRLSGALSSLAISYEIIFVDDGSRDNTRNIMKCIQASDTHIKIIGFARNFGQLYALLAGFEFAKGDVIITMDSDLQNDPADIPDFLAKINEGFDSVTGWRYVRQDPFIRKMISKLENWLIWTKTGIALHDYGCGFTVTRREIIDRLRGYGSRARFIKPLIVKLADSVAEIKVHHYYRKSGVSKYSMLKIIIYGLDFLFNFTMKIKKETGSFYVIKEKFGI